MRTLAGPPKFFGLAVMPTGDILAATFAAGVVRSGAESWSAVRELAELSTNTVRSTSAGAVLAGTNGDGLHRSPDGGWSWKRVDVGPLDTVYALAEGDALYAGTASEGVWRSADDGATWTALADGPSPRTPVYALVARADGTVAAGTGGDGLWWTNGGQDGWRRVGPPAITVHSLADLGAAVFAGCNGQGVLRSPDGETWASVSTGLDLHVHCLAAAGRDRLLAGTGAGVFVSSNSGTSWSLANKGMGQSRIFSLAVQGDGSLLAGGYDGVWRSTDVAASWHRVRTGLTASHVFAVGATENAVYGGTGTGLICSTDGGGSWARVDTDPPTFTAYCVAGTAGGRVLAGTSAGCLISDDRGETWRLENDGLTHLDIYALAALPAGELVAGTNGGGIFCSSGDRLRWTAANDGLPDGVVHDLLVMRNGDAVAASSNLAAGHKGGSVHRRRNGGWTAAAPGLPDAAVYGLAADRAGCVYAGVRGARVFRLDADDESWRDVSPGLVDTKMYGIAVTPRGSVLIGTGLGVHRSDDGGTTWALSNNGLASQTVYAFAADHDKVYAGTAAGVHSSADDGRNWKR